VSYALKPKVLINPCIEIPRTIDHLRLDFVFPGFRCLSKVYQDIIENLWCFIDFRRATRNDIACYREWPRISIDFNARMTPMNTPRYFVVFQCFVVGDATTQPHLDASAAWGYLSIGRTQPTPNKGMDLTVLINATVNVNAEDTGFQCDKGFDIRVTRHCLEGEP